LDSGAARGRGLYREEEKGRSVWVQPLGGQKRLDVDGGPEIYEHRSGSQDLKRGDTATGPTRCSHSSTYTYCWSGRVRVESGPPASHRIPSPRLRLRVIRLPTCRPARPARPLLEPLGAGRAPNEAGLGWARSPAPSHAHLPARARHCHYCCAVLLHLASIALRPHMLLNAAWAFAVNHRF